MKEETKNPQNAPEYIKTMEMHCVSCKKFLWTEILEPE